jgi:hypothetical protein
MTTVSTLGALALVFGFVVSAHAEAIPPLDSLRWKKRLILVFAPRDEDARLARRRGLLRTWKSDMEERDVATFEVTDAVSNARELRAALGVDDTAFATVLVGKDGEVKLRRAEPVAWNRLRAEIDAMPLRRREAGRWP